MTSISRDDKFTRMLKERERTIEVRLVSLSRTIRSAFRRFLETFVQNVMLVIHLLD